MRDANLALIRTRYPAIPRRVSGYNLDSLLPENGFNVARALVGSESTLVTILRAEIKLFAVPRYQALAVLGYSDIARAADAVPLVAMHRPLALEGLDHELIDLARLERVAGPDVLADLPEGSGWLMVRFGGDTRQEAERRAERLIGDVREDAHTAFLGDPAEEERVWRVREAGLGTTAYPPGHPDTHEGSKRTPPSARAGSATTCATCSELLDEFDYRRGSCTATSGRAASTPGSTSTCAPPTASRLPAFLEEAADLVVVLRRFVVGRARRRPAACRTARQAVRAEAARGDAGVQGDLGPGLDR